MWAGVLFVFLNEWSNCPFFFWSTNTFFTCTSLAALKVKTVSFFSLALRKLLCVTVRNLANQASASKTFSALFPMLISGYSRSIANQCLWHFRPPFIYNSWHIFQLKRPNGDGLFFHSHLSIFPFFFLNRSWFDLSEGWGHSHPHSLQHSSQSAELQMHWWAACGCRRKKSPHKKRKEKNRKRDAERKTSQRNLLPQHSVSDVVWHLVHKPSSIHTLQ